MSVRTGHSWIPLVAVPVIVVVTFAVIWAAAPEDLRGLLLLAAGVIAAAVYGALYLIQRRRHW